MDNLQRVQSVVAAHQVLEALSKRAEGTSLAELARLVDMTPTRVLRHLATLVELQLVERDEAETVYRLGTGLVRLAANAARQHEVGRLALPVLRDLNAATGQAVSLIRAQGNVATVWLSFESTGSPRLAMAPGTSASLTGSACGRAILAYSPIPANLTFGDPQDDQSPDPISSQGELENRLQAIRARGYDYYGTDMPNAVFSLGVPIKNHDGIAVAALGMFGFSIHYVGQKHELTRALIDAAHQISGSLGCRQ